MELELWGIIQVPTWMAILLSTAAVATIVALWVIVSIRLFPSDEHR